MEVPALCLSLWNIPGGPRVGLQRDHNLSCQEKDTASSIATSRHPRCQVSRGIAKRAQSLATIIVSKWVFSWIHAQDKLAKVINKQKESGARWSVNLLLLFRSSISKYNRYTLALYLQRNNINGILKWYCRQNKIK